MKKWFAFLSLVLIGSIMVSCYGKPGGGPLKSPAVGMALMSPSEASNKDAANKNDEGVSHLKQEHWDVSAGHFREAIAADPNLAEAHFNLALALDEMGDHPAATEQFKTAKDLAPGNAKIVENEVLKKHLQM